MVSISVAYLDCSTLAAELPTISSIRRFVQCVSLMPHGYFIPEFGRLAMDPPPPMQRVEWNAVAFSLPPMQSQQTECTVSQQWYCTVLIHVFSRDPRHASSF